MRRFRLLLTVAAGCACMMPATAAQLFFTDFESGSAPAEIGGAGSVVFTSSVNGNAGADGGFVSENRGTSPTTLTLTGLGALRPLDLSFTFLAIATWDGTDYSCCTTDNMNVNLNGGSIFVEPFRNFGLGGVAKYPGGGYAAPPAGTTITLVQNPGADNGTSVFTIAISGLSADALGNATFDFFASGVGSAFQNYPDEWSAFDNIQVSSSQDVAGTPEPGTLLLLAGGFAALGVSRLRRA